MALGTDFLLDASGDLNMTGGDASQVVRLDQAISNKLLLVAGEWFLNLDDGIPYYQEVLIKNPVIEHLETLFKDAILSFDEVDNVAEFTIDFDGPTRTLTIVWRAETPTGFLSGTEVI